MIASQVWSPVSPLVASIDAYKRNIVAQIQYWLNCTTTDGTIYLRLISAGTQYMVTFIGSNGAEYEALTTTLGATVDLVAQGLTSPYRVRFPLNMGADQEATSLYIHNNGLTGKIPKFTDIHIATFFAYGNNFNGWDGGPIPATIGTIRLENNLLPQATIDALLQGVVDGGKIAGTRVLNLGGSGNSYPSPAGMTNVDILINTMGWSVAINDPPAEETVWQWSDDTNMEWSDGAILESGA
jgi:hypothetical protein